MKIFRFGRSDYAWTLNFVRIGRTTREGASSSLERTQNFTRLKTSPKLKGASRHPKEEFLISVYSQWSYRTKEEWYSITRFKVRFLKWNRVTTRRWNLWRLISDRPSAFCGSLSIGTCGAQLHPHVSYGLRVTCLVSCLGLNETQFIV